MFKSWFRKIGNAENSFLVYYLLAFPIEKYAGIPYC